MEILLAEEAGFCFGVKRAIESAMETAQNPTSLYIHGTHNRIIPRL